jgi:excisionase family DNA binding protein
MTLQASRSRVKKSEPCRTLERKEKQRERKGLVLKTRTGEGDLLTVAEAAQLLRISRGSTYRLISDGELPALRLGGSIRVDRQQLAHFVYSNQVVTRAAR